VCDERRGEVRDDPGAESEHCLKGMRNKSDCLDIPSISVVTTLCLIGRKSGEFLVSSIFPAVKYEVALYRGVFGPAPTFLSFPLDGTPSWTADVAHDAFFFFGTSICSPVGKHRPAAHLDRY
jgi:hypothetical protein